MLLLFFYWRHNINGTDLSFFNMNYRLASNEDLQYKKNSTEFKVYVFIYKVISRIWHVVLIVGCMLNDSLGFTVLVSGETNDLSSCVFNYHQS